MEAPGGYTSGRGIGVQISDIMISGLSEVTTAREALLLWSQRSTDRYPGVKVTDFTSSWRDGLAFNAILHRNRPDLIDFRSLRGRAPRQNLEYAFGLAEGEFGVTRLLDPEGKFHVTHVNELKTVARVSLSWFPLLTHTSQWAYTFNPPTTRKIRG
uniref:Calponin-homology (CH) domain-containing protein n=1 Tax=Strigamia maritima TaxID=126957 RepID=T1JLI7_STRMM